MRGMQRWLALTACATVSFATGARAQSVGNEEIVVTATQRAASVQDVPVSVTAVTADLAENSGVLDIQDLTSLVASLQFNVSENETSATARLRGVGTQGSNPGLEASVGVLVDGVFRPRNGVALTEFGDLAQIEVLRGPQGTLFGRNTSAGLISLRSNAPDLRSFEAAAQGSYGNFNAYRVSAHLNAPLVEDVLALRIFAARSVRDGVLGLNPGDPLQRRDNERNLWTVRPQLLYEPSSNFRLRLIGDYARREEACCAAALVDPQLLNGAVFQAPPVTAGGPLGPAQPFGSGAQAVFAGLGAYGASGPGAGDIEDRIGFADRPFDQDIEEWGVSAEARWQLGALDVTSITAYRDWRFLQGQDIDFTQLDILFRPDDDSDLTRFENFSQELRVAGRAGPLDWLLGVFYTDETLSRRSLILLGPDFAPALAALNPLFGSLAALDAPAAPSGAVAGGDDRFLQRSESIAGFTHNILKLTARTELTLGVRFTHERKRLEAAFETLAGAQSLVLFQAAANAAAAQASAAAGVVIPAPSVSCNPGAPFPAPLQGLAGLRPGFCLTVLRDDLDGASFARREENEVTGVAALTQRFSPNHTGYVSYARGYKAGGFNLDRDFSDVDQGGAFDPQFEQETVDAFEAGLKNTLLGGDLLLNVAGFYNLYDDFQLNTFNGLQFVVASIPEVIARGLELDYVWTTPIEGLTAQGGVALTDARYGDDAAFVAANPNPITGELTLFRLPGARLTNAPLWTLTHAMTYRRALASGLKALAHVDVRYVSEQATGSDLDPTSLQPGFATVNGRLGLSTAGERLSLEVWARNLLDADFTQTGFNLPLQNGARGAFLGDPRTFGLTVRTRY